MLVACHVTELRCRSTQNLHTSISPVHNALPTTSNNIQLAKLILTTFLGGHPGRCLPVQTTLKESRALLFQVTCQKICPPCTPKSHEIFVFVCLQTDFKQCCEVTKLYCISILLHFQRRRQDFAKGGLTPGAKCRRHYGQGSGDHSRPTKTCSWNDWF